MKERLTEAEALLSKLDEAYYSRNDQELVDEINEELKEYADTLNNRDIIERIFEQYTYAVEDRETRAILPVKQVGLMEHASANYPFLLCICFCCAYAIIVEQTSKSHLIIRTAPNGQNKTMGAKLLLLFLAISVTSAALSIIDLVILNFQLPSEYWHYNVHSLEGFSNCPINMSIFSVFAAVQLMRLLGSLFIAAAAMLTAHFSHNYAASIFPYIALPVILDYVSERDSQSYFLPTGLLKGWGYFYGDVGDPYYPEYIMFHNIPVGYTLGLTVFSLLFIVGATALLISGGINRLTRKRGGIKKIAASAALIAMLLTITSCSGTESKDVLEQFGDSISVYGYNKENSRYKFNVEHLSYIDDSNKEHQTCRLLITDKETGETKPYPFDPFTKDIDLGYIFATEDFLISPFNDSIVKIDLRDFSLTTIYSQSGMKKVVFGLVFDFGSDDFIFSPIGGFSDGKTNYVFDPFSAVARLEWDGSLTFLITDDTSNGLEYDGKAFYYISLDSKLHRYDLKSGTNTVIYEGDAEGYTLDGDANYLYLQSNGKDVKLDKSQLTIK